MFWTKRMVMLALPSFFSIGAWFGNSSAAGNRKFANIKDLRAAVIGILLRKPGVTSAVPDVSDPAKIIAVASGRTYTIDLTNLFNRMRASPNDDPDQLIAEFTAAIGESGSPSEANLVVVLRDKSYVDQIGRAKPSPLMESYVGELSIVYMADMPGSMSIVFPKGFPGKNLPELHEIALNNVRKWLGRVKSDDQLRVATLYFVDGNTLLSPSLILLDEFWKSIAGRYSGDVLIAVPRRDQLFIFNDNDQGRAAAHRLIDVTFRGGFSLLSDKLFARRNGRIVSADR
jgi:uncharacterized protein YtpQ (UPF0354 family)